MSRYQNFLASTPEPKVPTGRRGQFVAKDERWTGAGDGWFWCWQDWGADYGFEVVIHNKRSGPCDKCGSFVHVGEGRACLKAKRWWLACENCNAKYEIS